LERYLRARWLWPGKTGTHVPRCQSLVIPPMDEVVSPRFMQRQVRFGASMVSKAQAVLGFSPEAGEEYALAQGVYLRRHRMGRGQPLNYGHAFTDWWEKYGTEHPEWFQLIGTKRGPIKSGGRYSMCISNQELRIKIVADWQAGSKSKGKYINAVE